MLRNSMCTVAALSLCLGALFCPRVDAGAGIAEMDGRLVASGLVRPIYATYAPGDATRLFIIEKQGRIRVLKIDVNPPVLLPAAFLDIDSQIVGGTSTNSEQGLLGLAFHPNYQSNGIFFVYYTANTFANTVARFQVSGNPDLANGNGTPGTVLLAIPDTESNHNGGWIGFKPGDTTGYLYIATGDGGGANDQHGGSGNGQNLTAIGGGTNVHALLGKILRLDIDGADGVPGNDDDDGILGNGSTGGYTSPSTNPFFGPTVGMDEIWSYGLRNPWRPSFDRLTGNLYIADVGQNAWEEISFQPSNSAGGENYGWRCMEGNACTGLTGCTCNDAALTDPIHVYPHGGTPFQCSITGGYVYRGTAISGLQGHYFFADYNCGTPGDAPIWTFQYTGTPNPPVTSRTAELAPGGGLNIDSITSFAEDLAGEIYICDQDGGEIFKIVPAPPPAPANNNCVNATFVTNGSHPFTTVNATTDGPDEPAGCNFGGYTQIGNDVWFRYGATTTGDVRVSLCGSAYNTKLAIYGSACPTVSGTTLACNDDACVSDKEGVSIASEVEFPVTTGQIYRIRIGGFQGATGTGTMVITPLEPAPCPADISPQPDGDGVVNVNDLLLVIGNWGATGANPADVNGDLVVNVNDLLAVIGAWGPCP